MLDGFLQSCSGTFVRILCSLSLVLVLFLNVSTENGGLEILIQLRTIMSNCLVSGKLGGVITGKMRGLSNSKLFFIIILEHLFKHGSLRHAS